jgi:glycosyl transferase family 25
MFFVYINLKYRVEKKRYMNNMLKSLNLRFERFEAIRPTLIESIKMDRLVPRVREYLSNKNKIERGLGLIGCYLSHLNVLKKYRNINSKYICVLEDDVVFDRSSIKQINKIINNFDKKNINWDIIRSVKHFNNLDKSRLLNNIIYKFNLPNHQGITAKDKLSNNFCGGTHFQLINVKNIEKIITYLNRENIYNIDSIYSTNELNIYAVKDKDLNIRLHEEYRKYTDIPKV